MGQVRYAIWFRGHCGDAVGIALQEGLNVVVAPPRTVLRGWMPDQAALLGILAQARICGLDLLEVRKLPQPPAREEDQSSQPSPGSRRSSTT